MAKKKVTKKKSTKKTVTKKKPAGSKKSKKSAGRGKTTKLKKASKSSKTKISTRTKKKPVTTSKSKKKKKSTKSKANSKGQANITARTQTAAPSVPMMDESIVVRPEPPSESKLRRVKTGLSRKDLASYQQLLLAKRAEILGDVAALESESRADKGEHVSPEHMADLGSQSFEQEFILGLVESERRMLKEIDEALVRIQNRTYGVCLERAVPIGRPRLDAKPWAKYCIEVVREKESRGEL